MALTSSYPSVADPIRVVLADDSAVVRGLLTRILQDDPMIKVVASGSNGEHAVSLTTKFSPHIVILDIEMPVMDGITALPQVIKACPGVKVIICSTLSLKNADITLKALSLGAADTIAKPTAAGQIIATENNFKLNLVNMVKQIAAGSSRPVPLQHDAPLTSQNLPNPPPRGKTPYTLRDPKTAYAGKPAILAIGSSTGGPPALFKVLASCKGIDIPILITQHMPPTFTAMLAQHIEQNTGIKTVEAKDGDVIKPGQAYVAPGGFHMVVKASHTTPTLHLNTDPPENFCRPAVDPMLRSVVTHYGAKTLAVILTGMGADGLAGAKPLIDAGGRLFAQDEASSVVWGMPGAVATAGLCHAVVPLEDMGPLIYRTIMGSKAGS
jgi:two-component system, chemotaxis family, protein-glutamate methylesterase/glutaminase